MIHKLNSDKVVLVIGVDTFELDDFIVKYPRFVFEDVESAQDENFQLPLNASSVFFEENVPIELIKRLECRARQQGVSHILRQESFASIRNRLIQIHNDIEYESRNELKQLESKRKDLLANLIKVEKRIDEIKSHQG